MIFDYEAIFLNDEKPKIILGFPSLTILTVNKSAQTYLRREESEVSGKYIDEILHISEKSSFEDILSGLEKKTKTTIQVSIDQDTTNSIYNLNCTMIPTNQESFILAELELQQKEIADVYSSQIHSFLGSLPAFHLFIDTNRVIKHICGNVPETLEMVIDENSIGTPIAEIFHTIKQISNDLDYVFQGKDYASIIRMEGLIIKVKYTIVKSEDIISGVSIFFYDVTSKKEESKQLRISEKIYELISENITDAYAVINSTNIIQSCSNDFEQLMGDEGFGICECKVGESILLNNSDHSIESGSFQEIVAEFRKGDQSVSFKKIKSFATEKRWIRIIIHHLENGSALLEVIVIGKLSELINQLHTLTIKQLQFFEHSSDIYFYILNDGTITFINPAVTHLLGWQQSEVTGKPISGFIHSSAVSEVYKKIKLVMNGENIPPFDAPLVTKKGSHKIFRFTTQIVRESGQVDGFIGLAHDITKLRKAELALIENEEKFRAIIENISDMVMLYNAEGKLTYVSPAVSQVLGYEPDEVLQGRMGQNLIHEDDENTMVINILKLLNKPEESLRFDTRFYHKDGSVRILELNGVNRINHQYLNSIILIAHDVTEMRFTTTEFERQQTFLKSLIDHLPVGINVKEIDTNNYILWNKKSESLFDTKTSDAVYKTDNEIFNEEVLDIILNTELEVLRKKEPVQIKELMYEKGDGNISYLNLTMVPLFDDDDALLYLITISENITEKKLADSVRKNLEQELFRLSLVAKQTTSSVIITNTDRYIIWINEAFVKLSGYDFSEVRGKTVNEISAGEETNSEELTQIDQKLSILEPVVSRLYYYRKDGSGYWAEVFIDPMYDSKNTHIGYIRVQNDITDKVNQEITLRQAKERAEELNRIKNNFLANMSHELRTPMIGILGYAEILQSELEDEEFRSMSEVIFKSGKKLLETMNLLLQLSKIESNRFEIRRQIVEVVSFLDDTLQIHQDDSKAKDIYLKLEPKVEKIYAMLDEKLFREILNNLINNAIKFTKKGGVTLIVEEKSEDSEQYVYIYVKDSGIGIAPESKKVIFEEFRQVSEGLNRHYEGTGLGLTITKKFTEIMNGSIELESEVGVGTTFSLGFPAIPDVMESITDYYTTGVYQSVPKEKHSRPIILIVEDDPSIIKLIKVFLSDIFDIDDASGGYDAIKRATDKTYDIILMDINLGKGLSGIETASAIRQFPGYESVPIVAITAYAMESEQRAYQQAGCSHFLSKPFNRQKIRSFINDLMEDQADSDEIQ